MPLPHIERPAVAPSKVRARTPKLRRLYGMWCRRAPVAAHRSPPGAVVWTCCNRRDDYWLCPADLRPRSRASSGVIIYSATRKTAGGDNVCIANLLALGLSTYILAVLAYHGKLNVFGESWFPWHPLSW